MKRKVLPPQLSLYPPYARDVRNLLLLYYRRKSTSIRDLKNCWKFLEFTRIHDASTGENGIPYDHFLQELYLTFLGYVVNTNNPKEIRVGSLYSMYYLYRTQKKIGEHRIKMSPDMFEILLDFRDFVKSKGIVNAYQVLLYLSECKAYTFVAHLEFDVNVCSVHTPFIQMKANPIPEMVNRTISLNSISKTGKEYYEKRRNVFFHSPDVPNMLEEIPRELTQFSRSRMKERISRNREYQLSVEENIENKFRNQASMKKTINRDFPRRRLPLVVEGRYNSNPNVLGTIIDYLPVKPEPVSDGEEEEIVVSTNQNDDNSSNSNREVVIIEDNDDDKDESASENELRNKFSLDLNVEKFESQIDSLSSSETSKYSIYNQPKLPYSIDPKLKPETKTPVGVDRMSLIAGFSFNRCSMSEDKFYIPKRKKWNIEEVEKLNMEERYSFYTPGIRKQGKILLYGEKMEKIIAPIITVRDEMEVEDKNEKLPLLSVPSILNKRIRKKRIIPSPLVNEVNVNEDSEDSENPDNPENVNDDSPEATVVSSCQSGEVEEVEEVSSIGKRKLDSVVSEVDEKMERIRKKRKVE